MDFVFCIVAKHYFSWHLVFAVSLELLLDVIQQFPLNFYSFFVVSDVDHTLSSSITLQRLQN